MCNLIFMFFWKWWQQRWMCWMNSIAEVQSQKEVFRKQFFFLPTGVFTRSKKLAYPIIGCMHEWKHFICLSNLVLHGFLDQTTQQSCHQMCIQQQHRVGKKMKRESKFKDCYIKEKQNLVKVLTKTSLMPRPEAVMRMPLLFIIH